jgi:hypothetical protein
VSWRRDALVAFSKDEPDEGVASPKLLLWIGKKVAV